MAEAREIWVLETGDKGQRVKDIQWLLSGHNRYNLQTYHGAIDGQFGSETGAAAKRMKFLIGYPDEGCVPTAGSTLRSFLVPRSSDDAALRPDEFLKRSKQRAITVSYPLSRHGAIIGLPGQGTHSYTQPPNNWESDRAVDIAVPVGTPVLACFAGTIGVSFGPLDSSNPRMAGLRLHVEGEHDEAYYAHLSKFHAGLYPGSHVDVGQELGLSGAANGVAHLHWALRFGYPPTFLTQVEGV